MKRVTINKYNVLGLMSGTSLDGVDIAYCHFEIRRNRWHFLIEKAQTLKYSSKWKSLLSTAPSLSGDELTQLHSEYGIFLGELCNRFIKKNRIKTVDLIASHGHTIFHQPKRKITVQLGNGNALHAITGLPVAYDFRSLDVLLGGQGAPLVPIGDQILFPEYKVCLNLGGIANLSMKINTKRIAFDVCFCNLALNLLASKAGKDFDRNGVLSSHGSVNQRLLADLKNFYSANRKKRPSLARESFEEKLLPLIEDDSIEITDRLRTISESIAIEIAQAIPPSKKNLKLLITGGGAHNRFLIELLQKKLSNNVKIEVPNKVIVDFKEALVFAFLGVLRLEGKINVLKTVTGATKDSCSGVLIGT